MRWEIHGYTTIFGSHYDLYVIDFDEYKSNPEFDDSVFAKPDMECHNDSVESASKWNNVIRRFATG